MITTIVFLLVIAILVLVHELGHFIVAKASGIRVDEFGIGFPPKLFGKKMGKTLYSINAIPFGGFVKIFGEDPELSPISEEEKKTSFSHKPKAIQAAVLVAGVTFNVIFAWLLLSFGFMTGMPSVADETNIGNIRDVKLVITDVLDSSPAKNALLKTGDEIVKVSRGSKIIEGENLTVKNVQDAISESSINITFTYKRSGKIFSTNVTPSSDIIPGKKAVGISMENIGLLKLPVHKALLSGAKDTIFILKETAVGLGQFLWKAVTFRSDLSQVAGPIGIAGAVGEAKSMGFVYLISLMALISINLAVINLLPFPALDGGRLLFVIIESITRRPISPKIARTANVVGFAFLIILMVVITAHDIFKLV